MQLSENFSLNELTISETAVRRDIPIVGVYKITSPNGKIYVGSSTNIRKRWLSYRYLKCKKQPKLFHSLKKYGADNHIFEILERCTVEYLFKREHYYCVNLMVLDKQIGLNGKIPGINDEKKLISDDTREKLRLSHLGKAGGRKGKKATQQMRELMSFRARNITDETRKKMSLANKKRSAESRLKSNAALLSPESREKARLRKIGRPAHNRKKIINIDTGIVYGSIACAAKAMGLNRGNLISGLTNRRPNNTPLRYATIQ